MKTERIVEFKLADTSLLAEHLAFLCKMLEAAENEDLSTAVEAAETTETMAA
jgi:hypothetical protein